MAAQPTDPVETTAVSLEARRRIGYVPAFDGLRGLGAVFVVAVHLFMGVIPAKAQLPNEIPGTFVFMDMFFVLSGFLITALLLREQLDTGRIRLGSFYRRRAMRLLPALYVLLLVHAIYAHFSGYPWGIEVSTIAHAAFYGVNFQMDSLYVPVATGLTQLWSLAVEEQFYLVWPLVVMTVLSLRRRLPTIVVVMLAAIAFIVIRRYTLWDPSMSQTSRWMRLYTHTDTRADSLLVGALLGYIWVYGKTPSKKVIQIAAWIAAPILVWFVFFVDMSDAWPYQGGLTVMAVAWAAVILACIETEWSMQRVLRTRVLRTLGEVSYGIYLWHVPAQYFVTEHLTNWPIPSKVGTALALTAVLVMLSWFFIEQPFLRWKDRIDRRQMDKAERQKPSDGRTTQNGRADGDPNPAPNRLLRDPATSPPVEPS